MKASGFCNMGIWRYALALSLFAFVSAMLAPALSYADLYPNPAAYPLTVSVSNSYQSVPVGSVCTPTACTQPTQAEVSACATGGTQPYTVIVYENQVQVDTGATYGCFSYSFAPPSVANYNIEFKFMDSASPHNTAYGYTTVVGSPQAGSSSGQTQSAGLNVQGSETVNVGEATPITLTIPGGATSASTVDVYVNGALEVNQQQVYSSYTYTLNPYATGTYVVEFTVSDGYSTTPYTATIYAVPGGGSAANPGGGSASGGTLSVSISPAYDTVAAGTPVLISATANGGTPPYSMELYDSSGRILTTSSTGTISFSYVPYAASTLYPVTVSVRDSAGGVVGQSMDIQTNAASSGTSYGTLLESVTPSTQSIAVGQSAQFAITATGGSAPYYLVIRDQNGDLLKADYIQTSGTPYSYSVPVSFPGTATYTFQVTDASFNNAYATASVAASGNGGAASSTSSSSSGSQASSGSPSLTATASPSSVSAGQQSLITLSASGGAAPYYYVIRNPIGAVVATGYIQASGGTATYQATVSSSGSYSAQITDSDFNSAYSTAAVTATGSASQSTPPVTSTGFPSATATASPSSVSAGQQSLITLSASGGAAPYYYVIRNPIGAVVATGYIQASGGTATYQATVSSSGSYSAQITDSDFDTTYTSVTVTAS